MIKRFLSKRIIMSSAVLFALLLLCLIPSKELKVEEKVKYIENDNLKTVIYLLDDHNYLARTTVAITSTETTKKAKELLQVLIKGGNGESKIPSGFQSILPSDTEILSIDLVEDVIKVNFSKKILDVKKENEEKMIEAIVYTLTSIEGVNKVIIYVEGDILSKLPQTGIHLPGTLDRSYGINKEYNIESFKDVNSVTVYYVSKYNDNTYYVPVTKYVNDDREKIKIIIDELASAPLYNTNLMSYLNSNISLLATEQELDSLSLVFNDYLFNDANSKNILEEVIYSISLSVGDNYDVKEVIFEVNNEEIYKSVIKTIE
ncbi:MAG: GerMN domain-containing protein [Tenericutes bacterium]|nr:GerMN domain-containing protein [Mycoplasmatota bacterium]